MSYILFVEGEPKPKTRTWYIVPIADPFCFLGWVKWFAPWRCYSFFPNGNAIFERRCLRDIADFCEARTAEHKRGRFVEGSTARVPYGMPHTPRLSMGPLSSA